MCTWNYHIDWIIFLHFASFFLFFFITRNSVQNNFGLNIENVLFLNWNFVFTIMIYNIMNEFSLILILILKTGSEWGSIQFAGLTKYSCTVHIFDLLLLTWAYLRIYHLICNVFKF